MEKGRITVIIPVHNGEKYIRRTVQNVLAQDYRNIEIILVENYSDDRSLSICHELSRHDKRVMVLICNEKGTSLARKKGILAAKGEYIVFLDQDDRYISNDALSKIYNAIVEDKTQICQFGFFKEYPFGIRRQIRRLNSRAIIQRNEMLKSEICGVWGGKDSLFSISVWSKIYSTEVLKSAVENFNCSLYFCEDMNLNVWAFFDDHTLSVSVRPEAYYVWKTGVGFSSSSKSGEVLLREYAIPKLTIIDLCSKYNLSNDLLYSMHLESLYFAKEYIESLIRAQKEKKKILQLIEEISSFSYIKMAKEYFNIEKVRQKKFWDELDFLSSWYSPDEYFDYCLSHLQRKSIIYKIKEKLRRLF